MITIIKHNKNKRYNTFSAKNIDFRLFFAKKLLKNNHEYVIIKLKNFGNESSCLNLKEKGLSKIMCKASEVGKIVVNKCLERTLSINTQKLQKLLVLIQVECIQKSKQPLFSEDIRVWDCGVAIKEVDTDFRSYGTAFSEILEEKIILLDSEKEYIDDILNRYGNLSASKLNNLSVNQKVISLGVIREHDSIPHITAEQLVKEFA